MGKSPPHDAVQAFLQWWEVNVADTGVAAPARALQISKWLKEWGEQHTQRMGPTASTWRMELYVKGVVQDRLGPDVANVITGMSGKFVPWPAAKCIARFSGPNASAAKIA